MDLAFAIHHLLSRQRVLPVLLLGGLIANQAGPCGAARSSRSTPTMRGIMWPP